MSTIDDGGPAFGQVVELRCVRVSPTGETEWEPALAQGGMTLRDYFAAKALQGLCAEFEKAKDGREIRAHYLAKRSYEIADAMLAARNAK